VRERAIRQGYRLSKSLRPIHLRNHGFYRLIDVRQNAIVMGENYDASLQNIERYLLGMKKSKRSHLEIVCPAQNKRKVLAR
jgi:hypothetical protein